MSTRLSRDFIREKIGFGVKDYFVPRQDGVQQYELNEDICKAFDKDARKDKMMRVNGDNNYAIFSIHDELIGPEGILFNMAVCQGLGYTILVWVKVFNGQDWGWIDIDGNFTDDQSKAEFGCWLEDDSYVIRLS